MTQNISTCPPLMGLKCSNIEHLLMRPQKSGLKQISWICKKLNKFYSEQEKLFYQFLSSETTYLFHRTKKIAKSSCLYYTTKIKIFPLYFKIFLSYLSMIIIAVNNTWSSRQKNFWRAEKIRK
jgi:hypothetical protein